jgi:hypothetical protein
MPANPTWTFERNKLIALYHENKAQRMNVALGNSLTLAQGTVLGEVTATPGVYKAYASGNADGTQVAKCVLEYACTTDASGNITLDGEFGLTVKTVSAFLPNSGVAFSIADLTGLDATALTALGGSIAQGALGGTGTVVL